MITHTFRPIVEDVETIDEHLKDAIDKARQEAIKYWESVQAKEHRTISFTYNPRDHSFTVSSTY